MKAARRDLAKFIAEQLHAAKTSEKQLSREVAAYLLTTNRTSELESLIRDVSVARAADGTIEVITVSAHQLPPAAKAEIKQQVKALYPTAKYIIVTERLDKSVLGGVRLEFPDKQYDATLRGKLNRFKQLTARD